jgi:hypothetical protein
MVVHSIFVAEHTFCLGDSDIQSEPVTSVGAVARGDINVMMLKPRLYGIDRILVRRNETIDLFLGQMLTIPEFSVRPLSSLHGKRDTHLAWLGSLTS